MDDEFPLSDTISFETGEGWYDLLITTVALAAEDARSGHDVYRTAADLHAPGEAEGDATLLDALTRDYADAASARAGHAALVRAAEARQLPLPIPADVRAVRKLRG